MALATMFTPVLPWYPPATARARARTHAAQVQAPRVWDQLKEEHPDATVFVNGWWHGMHDTNVDYFINVRHVTHALKLPCNVF